MPNKAHKFQILPFIVCIFVPLFIGFLGSMLTLDSVKTWYTTLNKPSFNPPNQVFGPVWTVLYILMGISFYLVWKKRKTAMGYLWAVGIYFLQLLLNLMWSYLFFYQHQIGFALIEIGLLLLTIIVNAFLFFRIDKTAGWLFLPYILWVSFASYLTYSISLLN